MSELQLSGRLPGGDRNGLAVFASVFEELEPPEPLIVVARVERKSRTVDDATCEVKALARISHVEVATGVNHSLFAEFLGREAARRSGDSPLDLDVVSRDPDLSSPTVQIAGWDGLEDSEIVEEEE